MKKIYLDYEDFEIGMNELVELIRRDKQKFDGVFGVLRGGLPIAVHLSHHLDLPLLNNPTKETLVVDDISDTGMTLRNIKHKKIACFYSTPWTVTKPDYSIDVKLDRSSLVIFPWEIDE